MSLKSLKIVPNASHYWKKLHFSLNVLKKPKIFRKASHHYKKASNSLKISLKCHAFLKKPRILKKSLTAIAALPQWRVRSCVVIFRRLTSETSYVVNE
jgi:hypothetical protein